MRLYQTIVILQHNDQKRAVSHLVLINEEDKETVTVKSLSQSKKNFTENKVSYKNVVNFLKQQIQGIDETVKK